MNLGTTLAGCAIAVHGGAGSRAATTEEAKKSQQGCLHAARSGWRTLIEDNGSALDAVMAAVVALEDNPQFNAGTGSVLNLNGDVETDAAIMDGSNLAAGCIGCVTGIKNPIRLARAVMEHSPHVFLVGSGAEAFAESLNIVRVNPEELVVPSRRQHWEQTHGTVGAVARDRLGRLAAATSTGGIFMKLPGRVGDTPLVGCGTYADQFAAVSATGEGEAIIRTTLARIAAIQVEKGSGAQEAADAAISHLSGSRLGVAGLIVCDAKGHLGWAHNTETIARAGIDEVEGEFSGA